MKTLLTLIRWIVGLLFIFSGLVKANDPLGLSYKMQEFFEVWGWQWLNNYALALSIVMNVFEVLAGVAVIVGWRMRLFSWLLLLLIVFFTFLTGYALLSGKIKTCGCFGDCLPLTPLQSFLKDLLLTLLIVILFINRNRIKSALRTPVPQVLLLAVLVGAAGMQAYALQHLPFVDCLPYKKGNNILQQMEPPAGSVIDSFAITFKYKKNGKEIEFDQANMPADLDSTYEYVDRYDKLVRKGNAVPPIEDFAMTAHSGFDTTHEILGQQRKYVLVFVQHFNTWNKSEAAYKAMLQTAQAQRMPVIVVTPAASTAVQLLDTTKVAIVTCDATVVKTAARVVPTFFLMSQANVLEKNSYRDVAGFVDAMKK
ncbi:BT_3928 family protein [Deminuibacter soli]|uniref:DoxX family protein n=1 Tax=Deminuibacter soli TaxID=2291815 RepID=A0A3E1NDD1_9BACT|nr:BT_3928 family protein [Deminuibacter soli]RFM25864.1 DoxX family protein [Deminuibacter soli]